jgi:hypothetical protein
VKFVDEDVVDVVDKDIMAAMKDEGSVEVFFDFAGNAVLVMGDRGEVKTDYFYGVVADATVTYQTRGDDYWTFDVLNEEGKVVKYDLKDSFVKDAKKYVGTTAWGTTTIVKDTVVKVTVDDKGTITKVENLSGKTIANDVKVDATYAEGYKLQADTIVFLANASDVEDYEVMKWSEAEETFSEVKAGKVFVGDKGRAGALFVTLTDVKTEKHVGLVTDVRKVKSSSNVWDVTIQIEGVEKSFLTDGFDLTTIAPSADVTKLADTIVEITLTDKDKIQIAKIVNDVRVQSGKVTAVSTSNKSVTVASSVYELVDEAVVYDATNNYKKITLRDLNENDTVTVYRLDTVTDRFVNYVIRTAKASAGGGNTTVTGKTVDAIDSVNMFIRIGGETYKYAFTSDVAGLSVGDKVTFTISEVQGQKYADKIVKVTP